MAKATDSNHWRIQDFPRGEGCVSLVPSPRSTTANLCSISSFLSGTLLLLAPPGPPNGKQDLLMLIIAPSGLFTPNEKEWDQRINENHKKSLSFLLSTGVMGLRDPSLYLPNLLTNQDPMGIVSTREMFPMFGINAISPTVQPNARRVESRIGPYVFHTAFCNNPKNANWARMYQRLRVEAEGALQRPSPSPTRASSPSGCLGNNPFVSLFESSDSEVLSMFMCVLFYAFMLLAATAAAETNTKQQNLSAWKFK